MKTRLFFSSLCLLFLLSPRASACIVQEPLTKKIKSRADQVFIGKVISYSARPKYDAQIKKWRPVVIRFAVEKTISGPPQKEIEVYWINGTFGESRSLEEFKKSFGERTLVGTEKLRNTPEGEGFQDRPWVVQDPCSPPYMWRAK